MKISLKNSVLLPAVLLIVLGAGGTVFAEYVFMNDGRILKGQILAENAAVVMLQNEKGEVNNINRAEVMRLLYTELYMGKVSVRKTDGKVFEAYMVDEDRDTYTFRRDINSPAEFKENRSDVLFIARSNPSGLKGTAEEETAELEWFAPFNQVKLYNIYYRVSARDEFLKIAESKGVRCTVTGLLSNTEYTFLVNAVDMEGVLSLPSNELKLVTKNILPDSPAELVCENTENAAGTFDARLSWQPAVDRDGTIAAYEVWNLTDGETLVARVTRTGYQLTGLDISTVYSYAVRAVDDRGGQSAFVRRRVSMTMPWHIGARGGMYLPVGDLADIAKPGYGGFFTVEYSMPFMREIFAGVDAGYLTFAGNCKGVDSLRMIPVELRSSYLYELDDSWSFSGTFACGMTFTEMSYFVEKDLSGNPVPLKATATDPSLSLAVQARWAPLDNLQLGLGCEWRTVCESAGLLHAPGVSLSCALRF